MVCAGRKKHWEKILLIICILIRTNQWTANVTPILVFPSELHIRVNNITSIILKMVVGLWWSGKSLFKIGLKMCQVYPLPPLFPLTRVFTIPEFLLLKKIKTMWQLEDIFYICKVNHAIYWSNLKAYLGYLKKYNIASHTENFIFLQWFTI